MVFNFFDGKFLGANVEFYNMMYITLLQYLFAVYQGYAMMVTMKSIGITMQKWKCGQSTSISD